MGRVATGRLRRYGDWHGGHPGARSPDVRYALPVNLRRPHGSRVTIGLHRHVAAPFDESRDLVPLRPRRICNNGIDDELTVIGSANRDWNVREDARAHLVPIR